MNLHTLKKSHQTKKTRKRVGRGPGSRLGKTCGRGQKGAGSRSGHTHRLGYEGGQFPLFRKIPKRGFSRARFKSEKDYTAVNLYLLEKAFEEGDTVSLHTLKEKGLARSQSKHVKILGDGDLSKKLVFEVHSLSASARKKLQEKNISFTLV